MSAIESTFAKLRTDGREGFIPFVTAGDPDLETSLAIILKLAELGSTVIELGVPFSDPMADGPMIQRSSQRSLARGTTLVDVLELAGEFRKRSDVPVVLFSYFNPIMRFGIENFANAAAGSGIDGVLFTDVIEDEAEHISGILAVRDIDLIPLIARTTTDERLAKICANARGFLYAVSRAGVTGASDESSTDAEALVTRARRHTNLPIAVGFGISTREQIADVTRYADAAVVGSAIVAEIERASSSVNTVDRVDRFVSEMLA